MGISQFMAYCCFETIVPPGDNQLQFLGMSLGRTCGRTSGPWVELPIMLTFSTIYNPVIPMGYARVGTNSTLNDSGVQALANCSDVPAEVIVGFYQLLYLRY